MIHFITVGRVQLDQVQWRERHHIGRTRRTIESSHLTEHIALAQQRHDHFITVCGVAVTLSWTVLGPSRRWSDRRTKVELCTAWSAAASTPSPVQVIGQPLTDQKQRLVPSPVPSRSPDQLDGSSHDGDPAAGCAVLQPALRTGAWPDLSEILRRERRHDSDQNDRSGQVQLADKTQKWVADKAYVDGRLDLA